MSDYFAGLAAQWDENPARAAAGLAFYAEVLRECPELAGKTALEFGCGTGSLGLRLAQAHGAHVVFVDTSPAMLAVLRGKLAAQGLTGAQADALVHEGALTALPERIASAGSLDVVLCGMALHHVDDAPGALRDFRRLLRPGGLALIGELEAEDGSFHGDRPAPHNGFAPADLAAELKRAGFDTRPPRGFHTVTKPAADGPPREYPMFFLAAQAV